jgi:hypothetical protein
VTEPNESDRKAVAGLRQCNLGDYKDYTVSLPPSDDQLLKFRAQARAEERETVVASYNVTTCRLWAAVLDDRLRELGCQTERERVIEECARVAEENLDHMDFESSEPDDWQAHSEPPFRCKVAAAIRALKEKRG